MGAIGLIGILTFFAGSHLLWQSRREIWFWFEEFSRILRGEFTRRDAIVDADLPPRVPELSRPSREARAQFVESHRRGALRLASGFALVFLGPVLFLLDLAF